jgi:hypothetical protein
MMAYSDVELGATNIQVNDLDVKIVRNGTNPSLDFESFYS